MKTNVIHTGDCLEALQTLPENSIHTCVTDPPYGLAFMGRDWDDFEPKEYQEWCEEWARECKRVLKPGGHLLAFSGNRTHHRLFTGVEDAGFEIRDTLTWHYGSGFPKASDISKTIDKREGEEREVTGKKTLPDGSSHDYNIGYGEGASYKSKESERLETAPSTEQAKKWDGWKTGLKPATEFVVMARKPYGGATVDAVLEHGTGALNIDGTRIDANPDDDGVARARKTGKEDTVGDFGFHDGKQKKVKPAGENGRYPSNVVFDATEAERLDREVGETAGQGVGGQAQNGGEDIDNDIYGEGYIRSEVGHNDSGGPSRYFYTSKASKSERTENGKIENAHPTVKPIDLMEWLVTLVTKENQIVLDPFTGSGTTCKAAKGLNRQFIGIEQQTKWADVARVRCGLTPNDPSVVRGDEEQNGLEAYQ